MRIAVGRFVRTFERVRGPGRTGYCRPPAMGPLLPPRATPTAARFAQGASERAAWRRAREPRPSGERGIGRVLLDEWPIDGSMQRYTYTLARREFNNLGPTGLRAVAARSGSHTGRGPAPTHCASLRVGSRAACPS